MNLFKCIVVDDEELARILIETYIGKFSFLELVGKCRNPIEAIEVMSREKVDLIFLDIQMPEMSGIDFLKKSTHKPSVILTTAYPDYALEGFELNVVDYLLKPFGIDRFVQAITKFQQISQSPFLQNTEKEEKIKSNLTPDYILVNSEHKVYKLLYKDIRYVQSLREYVAFHTSDGKRILSLMSLKKLETTLPFPDFLRVHKSYIVAVSEIKILDGKYLDLGEEKIPIGALYRDDLLARVFDT